MNKNEVKKAPVIEITKTRYIRVSVKRIQKASFNDEWLYQTEIIDPESIDRNALTWFDPFFGRSDKNEIRVAISYCSDDELEILEKRGDEILPQRSESFMDCIVSEDDGDSILAAHITLTSKR